MTINLGPVVYVSSVRHLGVFSSMGIGVVILKEKARGAGLSLGGGIMITGSVIICFYG